MARRTKQNRSGIKWQYRFLLNVSKELEATLAEYCEYLLDHALFASTIREALSLVQSLRSGDVSVLLSLFPWVEQHFKEKFASESSSGGNNDDIRQQLARLEQLMIQQGMNPNPPTHQKQLQEGAYMADDLDIEIKQAGRDENNNSGWNFLLSGGAMVTGFDALPDEVIEYGLRTGRLKPEQLTGRKLPKQSPAQAGNPKAMDVPQFDAPPDLEIDW